MGTTINLPVIERVVIHNFSLYPNTGKDGLDISFANGVTVVAGINGVGKTTLLTLLLRLLVGPSDPEKASRGIGRVSKRQLVPPKKFDFFASRVPEALGANSVATLHFIIKEKKIEVTRYMRDMKLKSVKISGRTHNYESEIAFLSYLAKLTGLDSGYDFHMVVRYLQFFSEDRLPLLWDASAQFEFFKILFFDNSIAGSLNQSFADIQRVDTDYRNRRHQLNKRIELLPPRSKADSEISLEALDLSIRAAQEAYKVVDDKYREEKDKLDRIELDIFEVKNKYEDAQIELSQLEVTSSEYDAAFILQALPSLDDKAQFLMQGISSGCGCFVCGTNSKTQSKTVSEKLNKNVCFVCNSPIKTSSTKNITPISLAQVRASEREISKLQEEIDQTAEKIRILDEQAKGMREALTAISEQRRGALQSWVNLSSQRPKKSTTDVSLLQADIDREEAELRELSNKRKAFSDQYRLAVDKAQGKMESVKEFLRELLTSYATAFLQEEVQVDFVRQVPFKLATGADRVNIPAFKIRMTSSTHKIAHERSSSSSVSESQKEFLDLAFRMTLLDMLGDNQAAMLVIETPEASLDSWFMLRAAKLMRKFAPEKRNSMRKLIATSNLNGTQMIPALLGLIDKEGTVNKLPKNRKNHLIDLLSITPKPATLNSDEAKTILGGELGRYFDV